MKNDEGKYMRYKKLLIIQLVAILAFTSISITVGAKDLLFTKDEIHNNRFGEFFKTRGFRSIFGNFFQMIRNFFSKFFNMENEKED